MEVYFQFANPQGTVLTFIGWVETRSSTARRLTVMDLTGIFAVVQRGDENPRRCA
jgi:hypothetical protein